MNTLLGKRDGFKLLSQKPCADMGKNEEWETTCFPPKRPSTP